MTQSIYNIIYQSIQTLKYKNILVIGVGGIGCQILKILCKMKVGSLHIVDMDTIEVSNLNRQFLFQKQHRGQSKSLTAKQAIKKLNPNLNLIAHHKNIKQLKIDFFKIFNYIIMALDNIDARNYVNKIGVRLKIPIIDAGTLGYKGNVSTIIPGLTKCYACEEKNTNQKSYPVCTIRNRPQKPVHCIVWAKLLFQVFFGSQNQENDLNDLKSALLVNIESDKQVEIIFKKLYIDDIQALKTIKNQSQNQISQQFSKSLKPLTLQTLKPSNENPLQNFIQFNQKLPIKKHIQIFNYTFNKLLYRKQIDGFINFQKDDDLIIHFISSAANLRMYCFSIQQQNFYEIKNIVGNIIPAIASTNSIVSGLQIIDMFKLIENKINQLRNYFIQNLNMKILSTKYQKPQQNCLVCSKDPLIIQTDTNIFLFRDLVKIIRENWNQQDQFSVNYGPKQLYNSQEPKQSILNKSINQICQRQINQAQFLLTDEETSQKICIIWIINTQNNQTKIKNLQQLVKKNKSTLIINGQQNHYEDQSSDLVVMDNNDDDDIEIIEVRKRQNNKIQQQQVQDKLKKQIKK